jgi:glycosyltransferase involved in cell wall biosynthesis
MRIMFPKNPTKSSSVRRVGIYNEYLSTLGGGENHMSHFIKYVNVLFPLASVDILFHETSNFGSSTFSESELVKLLEGNYNLKLANTHVRFLSWANKFQGKRSFLNKFYELSDLTRDYDLFINNTHQSLLIPKAKINVYYCMFPIKFSLSADFFQRTMERWVFYKFRRSYQLILANSNYTQNWIEKYWQVDSSVLSPPLHFKSGATNTHKENIIVSTGRFFTSQHNKKQDVMISAFIRMVDQGYAGNWKLVLVGRHDEGKETKQYIDLLEKMAKGYPIEFKYNISTRELQTILEKSKIYWHATGFGENPDLDPDKYEHFGITTVEAMQFGVVPVVINGGGQAEIVKSGQNGFLWKTLDELVEFSSSVIKNNELRDQLSWQAVKDSQIYFPEQRIQIFKKYLSKFYVWL